MDLPILEYFYSFFGPTTNIYIYIYIYTHTHNIKNKSKIFYIKVVVPKCVYQIDSNRKSEYSSV